jgi:hypothetical protein
LKTAQAVLVKIVTDSKIAFLDFSFEISVLILEKKDLAYKKRFNFKLSYPEKTKLFQKKKKPN